MSVFVSLETKVKPGQFEKLKPFLDANLPRVRGFAGALNVQIHHNEETEDFLIFEEWQSREHHQAYIDFISRNGVMAELVGFLVAPPAVKYYSRLPI